MWRPDGWDARVRIGVLVPHADVGPESELGAMAPPGVAVHASRVPFGAMAPGGAMDPTIPLAPVRAFAEPPHIDAAAELLAAAPIDAVGVGFTSHAYVIGAAAEADMVRRLEAVTRGIPVVSPGARVRRRPPRPRRAPRPPGAPALVRRRARGAGPGYLAAAGAEVLRSAPATCRAISGRSRPRRSTRGSPRRLPPTPTPS